jgi:hypothetical protein
MCLTAARILAPARSPVSPHALLQTSPADTVAVLSWGDTDRGSNFELQGGSEERTPTPNCAAEGLVATHQVRGADLADLMSAWEADG